MTKAQLTEKEIAALKAIGDNGLSNMGGKVYADLLDDNFSWFDVKDIMRLAGFSREQASGLMSALDAKGLISEEEKNDWALTDKGINTLAEIG